MKRLLFFSLLLLSGCFVAQDQAGGEEWPVIPSLPAREGRIFYEEVVEVNSSVPKDSLYQAARQWLEEYYHTNQPELQVDDKEAGQLIARGDHHYQFSVRESLPETEAREPEKPFVIHLQPTLHISVQDGQYQYRIYDFSAREEIRDLMFTEELDPAQEQAPEPRASRWAMSNRKREELFMKAALRSKLLIGLEKEVKDLIQSLKSAMATAAPAP